MLSVVRLTEDAVLPVRATSGSAGYDLASACDTVVPAHGKALVKTGLMMTIPDGTYGRIAPRSSLAWKHHIDVGAGVIDSDYRGEVGVVLFNHAATEYRVRKGERVAQLIVERIMLPDVLEVETLDDTKRGGGGFGSTN